MLPSSKEYAGQEDFHGPCICKCNLKELIPCSLGQVRNLSDMLVGAEDRRQKKIDCRGCATPHSRAAWLVVNDGISVGPLTFSAPPVIARLTSCMPQVVTPAAAAARVSDWKSSASGRWLPRWHSGRLTPGRRYLPARSISRFAAGKNASPPDSGDLAVENRDAAFDGAGRA